MKAIKYFCFLILIYTIIAFKFEVSAEAKLVGIILSEELNGSMKGKYFAKNLNQNSNEKLKDPKVDIDTDADSLLWYLFAWEYDSERMNEAGYKGSPNMSVTYKVKDPTETFGIVRTSEGATGIKLLKKIKDNNQKFNVTISATANGKTIDGKYVIIASNLKEKK